MTIAAASLNDIPELLPLVNSAYRGEASRKGWTTEADLLAGELRTDAADLSRLLQNQDAVILLCRDAAGQLLGCVYLDKRGERLYLGMLSVWPELQAGGIGRRLLEAAEEHAATRHCKSIYMRVLSGRHELIAWYERRGYRLTGERQPYDAPEQFGTPLKDLEFVVMEKPV